MCYKDMGGRSALHWRPMLDLPFLAYTYVYYGDLTGGHGVTSEFRQEPGWKCGSTDLLLGSAGL